MNSYCLGTKLTRHVSDHLLAACFIDVFLGFTVVPLVLVSKLAHFAFVHPHHAIWQVSNLVFNLL